MSEDTTPEGEGVTLSNGSNVEAFGVEHVSFPVRAVVAFDGDDLIFLGGFRDDTVEAGNAKSAAIAAGYKRIEIIDTTLSVPLITEQ